MTPAEIREFRRRHGNMSAATLAKLLPCGGYQTVQRWESGENTPPAYLARALRDLERELAEQPQRVP